MHETDEAEQRSAEDDRRLAAALDAICLTVGLVLFGAIAVGAVWWFA